MKKGRQKGQVKAKSIINDPLIAPFKITVEEDQYVLVDTVKNKSLSYHGNLEHAIKRISYISVVSTEEDYTLTGFIESYKNIVEHLTSKFKI